MAGSFTQGQEATVSKDTKTNVFKIGDKVVVTQKIPVKRDRFLYKCRLKNKPSVMGMLFEEELV